MKGAVLFVNNAKTFTTRKARLTYGVLSITVYDSTDPEHVRRQQQVEFGHLRIFSSHLKIGDDIPLDGTCPRQCYGPLSMHQSVLEVEVLASRERDIGFPDKDTTFSAGKVCVPLDMEVSFMHRAVDVQFVFGGTELSVNCFRQTTGKEVGKTVLSLVQEVEEAG